ncbi:MAG: PEP-CTERM sorting domain-containing protein [Phycisphaerae bacterium]
MKNALAVFSLALLVLAGSASATTVVVTGFPTYDDDGSDGFIAEPDANGLGAKAWLTDLSNALPIVEFGQGPGTAPLGKGSLTVEIPGSGSKILFGPAILGIPLASLTRLEMDVYDHTGNGNYYLNIYLDTSADGNFDGSRDISFSASGATVLNSWTTIDMMPMVESKLTTYPDAVISNNWDTAGGYPDIAVNLGDTASNFVDAKVSIDNLVIGYMDGQEEIVTIYDFEPAAAPVPEPATMLACAAGIGGLGGYIRRRRKA